MTEPMRVPPIRYLVEGLNGVVMLHTFNPNNGQARTQRVYSVHSVPTVRASFRISFVVRFKAFKPEYLDRVRRIGAVYDPGFKPISWTAP